MKIQLGQLGSGLNSFPFGTPIGKSGPSYHLNPVLGTLTIENLKSQIYKGNYVAGVYLQTSKKLLIR